MGYAESDRAAKSWLAADATAMKADDREIVAAI
jgi:hypothetical protein